MSDRKKTTPVNSTTSPRRILLVRNAYAAEMGGAEVFTYNLAYELQHNQGVEVFVSTSQKTLRQKCQHMHIQTVVSMWAGWLQPLAGWRNLLLPLWLLYGLLRSLLFVYIIVRHKVNFVHVQSRDDFIAGTLAAKLTGTPLLWTDHADLKHLFINHHVWYKNFPGKLVFACAKWSRSPITVVSKSELRAITASIGKRLDSQLRVVHNGVIDRYEEFPETPSTRITIGTVSRLTRDKGVFELVDAYQMVRKTHPELQLTIVGDGPARAELEAKAKPFASEVTFTGYTHHPLQLMSEFDVFVYPTHHEALSLALLEASMMQRCIITTDVGGNPEIITDGQQGLLVPARDSQALASAIARCLESPRLRHTLAAAARQRYQREFNFSAIVKQTFMELYQR